MTTLLPPNVKVHLALGFIDMRNYAPTMIMRSRRVLGKVSGIFPVG
jgi:hypothetical protein